MGERFLPSFFATSLLFLIIHFSAATYELKNPIKFYKIAMRTHLGDCLEHDFIVSILRISSVVGFFVFV